MTIGGGIRSHILSTTSIDRFFLDSAPAEDVALPYITMNDNVGTAPHVKGDGRTLQYERQVQLDLWEVLGDEDPMLAVEIREALNGAKIDPGVGYVFRCGVLSADRIPEAVEDGVAHTAITVMCIHDNTSG